MVDVLTWTIERRMRLTERAELLRKELAEVDAELGRLEAARGGVRAAGRGDGRETAAVGHRGAGAGARRGWAGCGRDAVGAGPCRGDGAGVPDLGVKRRTRRMTERISSRYPRHGRTGCPCENHWCPACSSDGLTPRRESAV
jgi:hypothetical protein